MIMWYYSKVGRQQGPVPEDELRAKIRRGEIDGPNLVWKEGMPDWLPLSRVRELSDAQEGGHAAGEASGLAQPPVSPGNVAPGPPVMQPGGNVPLPQPPAFHGNYVAPDIPTYMTPSIIALVMWCVSMLLICLPIGLPFAIVAVVFATKVDSLRAQGNLVAAQAASRTAKIWMIVAYATFGLPVMGIISFLIFTAVSAGAGP